jgi:protein arginine kinase activator
MSESRCDACGKLPATVRYTEIDEGRVTKRGLCRACAASRGLLDEPPKPMVVLEPLLGAAGSGGGTARPPTAKDPACPACGTTFLGFRQRGRLGCSRCWAAFESELVPLLRKLHGHSRHVGKAPHAYARKAELRQRVEDLRAELDRAVRGEDYERAARLRDEIRAVEHDQSRAARRGSGVAEEGR